MDRPLRRHAQLSQRLLPEAPWLATYGALGYYISWVAVLPVNAIVLTDLVQAHLEPFGIHCPTAGLALGFTAIASKPADRSLKSK